MNIALVSPYDMTYPGGVRDHITHLSAELRAMGHTVKIIAPTEYVSDEGMITGPDFYTIGDWDGLAQERSDEGMITGPDFYGIGRAVKFPANGSTARISLQPFALSRPVKEVLRAERFDVIHLHEPLMPNLPHVVLRHSTSVNVGTFHAYSDSNMGYAALRPYLRRDYRKLHSRIAVSPAARAYVQSYFSGRVVTIPNGIELEQFGPEIAPFPQYRDGRPTILFVGRYNEARKGFKYLTRAMVLVRQQFPTVRLLVVGRGNPKRSLRFMESHGLAGNVEFVGFASDAEKPRYFASADIFCSPATGGESFGMVVMEAMAAGRPVVTTAIPGHLGIMTNDHEGLLVEPESPQALALAFVRLLADATLRREMGVAGRATAARYSWRAVSRQVVAQYEQAERLQRRLTALRLAIR